MNPTYMIVLTGQGDTLVMLLDSATWMATVSSNPTQSNDKALELESEDCLFYTFGDSSDVLAAKEWADGHGYVIADTFDGYIY